MVVEWVRTISDEIDCGFEVVGQEKEVICSGSLGAWWFGSLVGARRWKKGDIIVVDIGQVKDVITVI
jgi:hypothetical protein